MVTDEIKDRARGALLGQACGDALGTTVEFKHSSAIARLYPAGLQAIIGGGPFGLLPGQVTDDTELALALARSLVRRGGFDEDDIAEAYQRWAQSGPFDIGNTTIRAFGGMEPPGHGLAVAIRHRASQQSQANGSMMRQSPLGLFGWKMDPDSLAVLAAVDSTLSHPHLACREACAGYTFAIAQAVRTGASAGSIYSDTLMFLRERPEAREHGVVAALEEAAEHNHPDDFDHQMGWVIKAFQNAFFQLLHAPSFESGVVRTVMLGGDTDTNACIAGALLGSVYGAGAVPQQWSETVLSCRTDRPDEYQCGDLLALADALVAL